MKISSSGKAKIGAAGQVLATKWTLFISTAGQKCHYSFSTEHKVNGNNVQGPGCMQLLFIILFSVVSTVWVSLA